jgi:hypothetical protein
MDSIASYNLKQLQLMENSLYFSSFFIALMKLDVSYWEGGVGLNFEHDDGFHQVYYGVNHYFVGFTDVR